MFTRENRSASSPASGSTTPSRADRVAKRFSQQLSTDIESLNSGFSGEGLSTPPVGSNDRRDSVKSTPNKRRRRRKFKSTDEESVASTLELMRLSCESSRVSDEDNI